MEEQRLEATFARIVDLEERATAGLAGSHDDLAGAAAEGITLTGRDALRLCSDVGAIRRAGAR